MDAPNVKSQMIEVTNIETRSKQFSANLPELHYPSARSGDVRCPTHTLDAEGAFDVPASNAPKHQSIAKR